MIPCFGDSLTAGTIGIGFSAHLTHNAQAFTPRGINGDTLRGITARAEQYLMRRKTASLEGFIIEAGNNDLLLPAMAAVSPAWKQAVEALIREDCEPISEQRIFLETYAKRLKSIMTLAEISPARIGIMSLPPLGENLSTSLNRKRMQFNSSIAALTAELGLSFIDIAKPLEEEIYLHGKAKPFFPGEAAPGLFERDAVETGNSPERLEELSEKRNLVVTTDGLHFNERGSTIAAEPVDLFLHSLGK